MRELVTLTLAVTLAMIIGAAGGIYVTVPLAYSMGKEECQTLEIQWEGR